MADLKEVFEMATTQIDPDQDSWKEQERRQRRAARNRKLGAFAAVAVVVLVAAAMFILAQDRDNTTGPAHEHQTPRTLTPTVIGLNGTVLQAFPDLPPDAWEATLSPDARAIAYVTIKHGATADTRRIVVTRTDGAGTHVLTPASPGSPGDGEMPAWSPDGSRIAFAATKNENQDIYVVKRDGTDLQRLTTALGPDEFPVWSPDGSTIAYDGGTTPNDSSGLSPTQEIWIVPAAGGAPVRLTQNHVPDQAPTYSPDGAQLAFFEDGSVVTMHDDGTHVRALAGASGGWSPRWSPDGNFIAFQYFGGDRGVVPDPLTGDPGRSLPLSQVKVASLATGHVRNLGVEVPSSWNAVSWTPGSDGLLVERFTPLP